MHYSVEAVLSRRVCADTGTVQYYLKWEGCDEQQNSWEPRRNLVCCDDHVIAVDRYHEKHVLLDVLDHAARVQQKCRACGAEMLMTQEVPHDQRPATMSLSTELCSNPTVVGGSCTASNNSPAPVVLLGEFIHGDVERTVRSRLSANHSNRSVRRRPGPGNSAGDPALAPSVASELLERHWSQQHADSLFRAVTSPGAVAGVLEVAPQLPSGDDTACATSEDITPVVVTAVQPARTYRGHGLYFDQSSRKRNRHDECACARDSLERVLRQADDDQLIVEYCAMDYVSNAPVAVMYESLESFREDRPQALLDYLLSRCTVVATL